MQVRFWGTRGSLAKPGPDTLRYGGNTSCIEVRSAAGTLVVIDCGTGAHDLGRAIQAESDQPVHGHLLISHTHWDHIQGIPFFAPLAVPENHWDIYAPRNVSQSVQDTLAGQMQYTYFPITIEALGAKIRYHDLVEGVFQVGDITVRTCYLNHTALTLGYRLEADGHAVVYACDHEPYPRDDEGGIGHTGGQNARHVSFLRDADLVIHDAQYTEGEYPGKIGWGHSTGEYAIAICREAGAKQLALTHHDPSRKDEAVDEIMADLRNKLSPGETLQVFAAAEGQTIEFEPRANKVGAASRESFSAAAPIEPAIEAYSILLGVTDVETAGLIAEAAATESVRLTVATSTGNVLDILETDHPSLLIVDDRLPEEDLLKIGQMVRQSTESETPQAPIVMIAGDDRVSSALDEFITETVVRPVTLQYMRTRLRAWMMRMACRWVRARRPDNEDERLAALRELDILDTEPEERFDNLVRAAAEALDIPIALVSLVDRDRQWFKSRYGMAAEETPHDMSFCAHAVVNEAVLVVPDTLLDERFADNPLVTGDQRIRFYAGCPLRLPNGLIMGTLCMIDSRPRQFDNQQLELLEKFGKLAELQLVKPHK